MPPLGCSGLYVLVRVRISPTRPDVRPRDRVRLHLRNALRTGLPLLDVRPEGDGGQALAVVEVANGIIRPAVAGSHRITDVRARDDDGVALNPDVRPHEVAVRPGDGEAPQRAAPRLQPPADAVEEEAERVGVPLHRFKGGAGVDEVAPVDVVECREREPPPDLLLVARMNILPPRRCRRRRPCRCAEA